MKNKLLTLLLTLTLSFTLIGCSKDETCKIKGEDGESIEVNNTEDVSTVSKVIDALNYQEVDNSSITSYGFNGDLDIDVDLYESTTNYAKLNLDLDYNAYLGSDTNNKSINNYDFYLDMNLLDLYDIKLSDLGLDYKQEVKSSSLKLFSDSDNLYLSYKNINLSSIIGSNYFLPSAKYYLSFETLKNLGLDEAFSEFNDIDLTGISKYIEMLYNTPTIDYCKALGISIVDTSKDEIEFNASFKVNDLLTLIKKVFKSSLDNDYIGMIDFIGSIIGDATFDIDYRININTLMPTKISFETDDMKESLNNFFNTTKTRFQGFVANEFDIEFNVNIVYNISDIDESIDGYKDISEVVKEYF